MTVETRHTDKTCLVGIYINAMHASALCSMLDEYCMDLLAQSWGYSSHKHIQPRMQAHRAKVYMSETWNSPAGQPPFMAQKGDRHIILYMYLDRSIAKSWMVHPYWPYFTRSNLPLSNYTHAVPNSMQTVCIYLFPLQIVQILCVRFMLSCMLPAITVVIYVHIFA